LARFSISLLSPRSGGKQDLAAPYSADQALKRKSPLVLMRPWRLVSESGGGPVESSYFGAELLPVLTGTTWAVETVVMIIPRCPLGWAN
jgi:hypothetical protein